MAEKRPLRVVVLGGGFAGGYVAKHLFDKNLGLDVEVIIIDRNNFKLWNIGQVRYHQFSKWNDEIRQQDA